MKEPRFKLCIWMNIPSHYQSAFFAALVSREDTDLKVVYLNGTSESRAAEGWRDTHDYQPFECSAAGVNPVNHIDNLVQDWRERIHLICGYFASDLIDHFCHNGAAWCHWSEKPGIRLAELLGYRTLLFRMLYPLMLSVKRGEGQRIRKYALGAFGQGHLARKAFRRMGVPAHKIADLYYVPDALSPLAPCADVVKFAAGRKVFLAVGALCRRKGIDLLLQAFARQSTEDWCLVLCGLDRSDGYYPAMSRRLGIDERVFFMGAYPAERIAEVYRAADVFVLASRFDGWGAVLNEAASLGLPLIGTDLCGASWHVVEPGRNGFRVRAGSVHSLSEAMAGCVAHPERMQAYGAFSARLFREKLMPGVNAERLVQALENWSLHER